MPYGDTTRPEVRAETDASLRRERDRTDEELVRQRSEIEAEAGAALGASREHADRVISGQRREEDERAEPTPQVRTERLRADAEISKDRRDVDASLEADRVRRQIAVASLVLSERQQTDSRLLIERTGADEVLTRRDEFLAMLSHDMRSLLGTVALSAAMLEQQHDPSSVARCTGSIQRATAQMSRLVADLLDVASFDAGKFVLLRGLQDVGQLVREAADAFEATTSKNQIALSVDVAGEDLIANCDADRMAQVLANLLGNATKFTRPGGKITIRVARSVGEIVCSVSDTGEGIAPEKLRTIFDRYSQSGRTDPRGLGLGLYIAQRIVDAHGGRIWVDSVVGQGSTFFFAVPTPPKSR